MSIWGFPYRLYGRLCGLASLMTLLRQISAYKRFSERRWYRVATPGHLLILRVLHAPEVLVDDVPLREALGAVQLCGLQHTYVDINDAVNNAVNHNQPVAVLKAILPQVTSCSGWQLGYGGLIMKNQSRFIRVNYCSS